MSLLNINLIKIISTLIYYNKQKYCIVKFQFFERYDDSNITNKLTSIVPFLLTYLIFQT